MMHTSIMLCISPQSTPPLHVTYQAFLRFDERPVDTVHLVIEAAGVAQVVSGPVPAPKWRGDGAAVDTLSALSWHVIHQV